MKLKRTPSKQSQPQSRRPQPSSQSARVFSYHANRSAPEASQVRDNTEPGKRNSFKLNGWSWLRNLPTILATIAIVVSVIYMLGVENDPQIIVRGPGAESIVAKPTSAYRDGVAKRIGESFWSGSKLTIDTDGIANRVQQDFPELDAASIALPAFRRRPLVTLHLTKPALVLKSNGELFILDGSGRVLSAVPESEMSDDTPMVTDETGITIAPGDIALAGQDVAFIREVVAQLQSQGITVDRITLPPIPAEMHLWPTGVNYFVKFNFFTNARVVAGEYVASKQKLEADGEGIGEYIDARVEEKVFYR